MVNGDAEKAERIQELIEQREVSEDPLFKERSAIVIRELERELAESGAVARTGERPEEEVATITPLPGEQVSTPARRRPRAAIPSSPLDVGVPTTQPLLETPRRAPTRVGVVSPVLQRVITGSEALAPTLEQQAAQSRFERERVLVRQETIFTPRGRITRTVERPAGRRETLRDVGLDVLVSRVTGKVRPPGTLSTAAEAFFEAETAPSRLITVGGVPLREKLAIIAREEKVAQRAALSRRQPLAFLKRTATSGIGKILSGVVERPATTALTIGALGLAAPKAQAVLFGTATGVEALRETSRREGALVVAENILLFGGLTAAQRLGARVGKRLFAPEPIIQRAKVVVRRTPEGKVIALAKTRVPGQPEALTITKLESPVRGGKIVLQESKTVGVAGTLELFGRSRAVIVKRPPKPIVQRFGETELFTPRLQRQVTLQEGFVQAQRPSGKGLVQTEFIGLQDIAIAPGGKRFAGIATGRTTKGVDILTEIRGRVVETPTQRISRAQLQKVLQETPFLQPAPARFATTTKVAGVPTITGVVGVARATRTPVVVVPKVPTSVVRAGGVRVVARLKPVVIPGVQRFVPPMTKVVVSRTPVSMAKSLDKVLSRTVTRLETRRVPISKARVFTGPVPDIGRLTERAVIVGPAQRLLPRQRGRVLTRTTTGVVSLTTPRITTTVFTPFAPLRLRPRALPFLRVRPQRRVPLERGFGVLVKTKGLFKRVNVRALTKQEATLFGARVVSKTAAATFKLVKLKEFVKPGVRQPTEILKQFRDPIRKGKRLRGTGLFIERTKFRIDQPTEKKQITFKGLLAIKQKRQKLFKI